MGKEADGDEKYDDTMSWWIPYQNLCGKFGGDRPMPSWCPRFDASCDIDEVAGVDVYNCGICMDGDMKKGCDMLEACGHVYCSGCVQGDSKLKTTPLTTCPLCRAEI